MNELKCETLIIVLKIVDHKPCLSLFDYALLCFMLLMSVCGRSLAAHYPKEHRRAHCILAIIFSCQVVYWLKLTHLNVEKWGVLFELQPLHNIVLAVTN